MSVSATAQRFFGEVWSAGKLDLVDELFAPGYVGHPSGPEETVRGPEGIRRYVGRLRQAFPDLTMTVEDQIAERGTNWDTLGLLQQPGLAPQPAVRERA